MFNVSITRHDLTSYVPQPSHFSPRVIKLCTFRAQPPFSHRCHRLCLHVAIPGSVTIADRSLISVPLSRPYATVSTACILKPKKAKKKYNEVTDPKAKLIGKLVTQRLNERRHPATGGRPVTRKILQSEFELNHVCEFNETREGATPPGQLSFRCEQTVK